MARLVLFDPETGTEEVVESDPLRRVDMDGAAFSIVTGELVFKGYVDDRQQLYFRDKTFEKDYKLLRKKSPNRGIGFDSSTADEMTWLITAFSDTEPGRGISSTASRRSWNCNTASAKSCRAKLSPN